MKNSKIQVYADGILEILSGMDKDTVDGVLNIVCSKHNKLLAPTTLDSHVEFIVDRKLSEELKKFNTRLFEGLKSLDNHLPTSAE